MKVIIAGSRTLTDWELVHQAIKQSPFVITEVVCGMARGVDSNAKALAEFYRIPIKEFPAEWNLHGKAAGPIRNKQMAEYADSLISIWDGSSRGTLSMIHEMKKLGKPVQEWLAQGNKIVPIYPRGIQ